MGVRDFYAGKNILITGVTEFLGKVILEKILRSIPDVGTIYLLIRSKEGSSFTERFRREVASSPCFDRLRKTCKKFDEFLESKIVPLAGVLVNEGLGLSDETRKILIDNVNIVIHCAATADLNARLDNAVKINVRGPMEVLRFVSQIKNLENFVYVSTCYVNSDKRGTIEERIYEIDQDPDLILKEIENLRPDQVVQRTPTFIGNFPNTLTFTFSLCERLLAKHKRNVPLTIVRLSMLGAAWRDPFPGWVDKVSTASALYLLGGIGLIRVAKGDPSLIGDQIPIDFCANAIIVAGAKYARTPDTIVVHCGTSSANPVTWKFCIEVIQGYWNQYPPQKRVAECNFRLQKNPALLKAEQFARRAPTLLFHKFAYAVDYPGLKRTASKSYNALLRSEQLSHQFEHFTMNEWIFLTHRLEELREFCTEEEKDIFQLNVSAIEWRKYLLNYTWGLQRFILKENIDPPTEADKTDILLTTGTKGLSNYTWILSRGNEFKPLPVHEMKALVLQSKKVNDVIKDLVINKKSMNLGDQQFEDYLYKIAAKECDFIFSNYHINLIRGLVSIVTMVIKNVYDKIVVDEAAVEALRNFDFKKYGPIVFMPSHRSYMDFLMLSYILFTFSIKTPQIVAAEDFLGMALIPILLRGSGAFFIRRKKPEFPEIYNAVLYEYIQRLLITQNWLEFFVEGTRSRYGKTMAPKFGIISIIMDALLDNKLPDVHIVPVTLNYDRVFEGETFPYELLGEQKVKESLTRMIKGLNTLSMNFGKIYVEISKPFSLKQYIENTNNIQFQGKLDPYNNHADRFPLAKILGYEMVYQINENLIVMPSALIASVILAHRKGLNEENLHAKVEWLVDQLQLRKIKIGAIEGRYSHISTKSSLALLENQIHQKKDIFHIHVAAKEDYKNILMLSYYRNTLIHAFWLESIVACALSSFGRDIAWKEGVSMERLWTEVNFLNALVSKEFQLREKLTKDFLPILVDRMIKRGILEVINGDEVKVKVVTNGDEIMSFLCHLIWPFLESYWLTSVYLFSMRNRTAPVLMRKFLQEIQWFAESIYEERMIEFYEACALDTIKNAVSIFKEMKAISVAKKLLEKTNTTEEIVELAMPEEKIKAIEDHIKKFLKDSFAKSVNSPIELARKSVLLDYPFMAKL